MAAIKGNFANVDHYVALEADFSEPSVPPEPVYDPKINPYTAELPYPEINLSPAKLFYPDGNPCIVDPLSGVPML